MVLVLGVPSLYDRLSNIGGVWGSKVTAELKKHDIETLISLLALEIDRWGEAKEKQRGVSR